MSDTNLNPEEAARRARELIEADVNARVDAVREVVTASNDADEAERRWKDAAATHERAWRAALDTGWSEKDLRATGARAPGQATRARRPRTTSPRTATTASPASSEG
jgi:RecB family exonuclease